MSYIVRAGNLATTPELHTADSGGVYCYADVIVNGRERLDDGPTGTNESRWTGRARPPRKAGERAWRLKAGRRYGSLVSDDDSSTLARC